MKRLSEKWLWLAAAAGVLLVLLCAWMFGWFRGNINMMRFSPDEVDRIELYSTDLRLGLHTSVVTDRAEIQALIDSVNSFQHTGSRLKEIFKYGIFVGGSTLYVCNVYLLNGENFNLHFSSNSGGQPLSDMEMSYWVYQPERTSVFPDTCRGSLELFADLYEKYRPTDQTAY